MNMKRYVDSVLVLFLQASRLFGISCETNFSFLVPIPVIGLLPSCCQLMNERMMAAADSSQQSAAVTPVNTMNARQPAKDAKKAMAAERIGVNNNPRRR